MFAVSVLLCFLQAPTNPVRAQEAAVMMARSGVPTVEAPASAAPHPYLQEVRVRRFEERFNKLVKAVEEFSVAYNESKGQVWPSEKANALKKAMEALQKVEPTLSAKQ